MFKVKSKKNLRGLSLIILVLGLSLIGIGLNFVLRKSTENQVAGKALMLLETMNSVRNYTSTQVKPELIERTHLEFLPQTIPAYSAREVFEGLRLRNADFSEFRYKEAVLNPSNLRDKANRFEEGIIRNLAQKGRREQKGFKNDVAGKLFYLARPIQITKASCLQCHSTPDVAPKSVIDRYGPLNGMGWKLNEIVGAQIITVPAKAVISQAHRTFGIIMAIVSTIFALVIVVLDRAKLTKKVE